MRMPNQRVIASYLMLVYASATAHIFGQQQQITSMKLLTPEIGWTSTSERIFWTETGGFEWKDITPSKSPGQSIASAFFLDTSRGWVLLIGSSPEAAEPSFDLASTTDAGDTWNTLPLQIEGGDPQHLRLGGGGDIFFVDSAHGWLNLNITSSSNFRLGIVLATSDGGDHWRVLPRCPRIAGSVYFTNERQGWLVGGPGDHEIYATWDGGTNWQPLSFFAPADASPAIDPTYTSPVFESMSRA